MIPAYNEAQRILPTLDRVLAWAGEHPEPVEVIVVDDGSTDATRRIVAEVGDPVRLVCNPGNRGKGYSVAHGVREATGQRILFSDADLSTPIEDYEKLATALGTVDIAIGSRALPTSNVERHQPWYREAMGRTFNVLVQGLAVRGIHDTQCGFKLFRAAVAHDLFGALTTDGFAFDVEILFLARRRGYSIAEVPVTWVNDDRSRVHAVFDSARMLRDIIRIRARHSGRTWLPWSSS